MWAHLNVMSSSIKAGRKIWNTFVGSLFFLLMATRKPFTVSVMCVFFFTLASSLFDWKNLKCHFVCERKKNRAKARKRENESGRLRFGTYVVQHIIKKQIAVVILSHIQKHMHTYAQAHQLRVPPFQSV